jgi:hypothetical protein
MKHLKTYEKIKEGKKENIIAGLMAATYFGSCKKDQGVDITIKFGIKSAKISTEQSLGSQKDFIGNSSYWVTKEDLPRNRILSPQWVFCQMPTPEQMVIVASYHNYQSELDMNSNLNPVPGENVKIFDLNDVETKQGIATGLPERTKITDSDYYKKAWEWCKSNIHIFQNDLTNLKNSNKKPSGLIGELSNFEAMPIIMNPENHPR